MAIDTADKRASALLVGVPTGRVYPTPDGSLATAADRQHVAYLYRGIAAQTSVLNPARRLTATASVDTRLTAYGSVDTRLVAAASL